MSSCKTLIRTSLSSLESQFHSFPSKPSFPFSLRPPKQVLSCPLFCSRPYGAGQAAVSLDSSYRNGLTVRDEDLSTSKDNVEKLLTNRDDVTQLMKMERRCTAASGGGNRRFPYLDRYKCGDVFLSSGEVVEAVGPYLMEERKERFVNVVKNRSYSVCLVVEGLSDFGNVSAAFRSADAMGVQSVHVVSCDSSKRCKGF